VHRKVPAIGAKAGLLPSPLVSGGRLTHSVRTPADIPARAGKKMTSGNPCRPARRPRAPRTLRSVPHEAAVVPPHAVHRAARRFPGQASLGVGRHPFLAVRPQARPPHVQRLHGRDGVRGGLWLRCDLLQRAPLQRLRPHALAEPDRDGAGAANDRYGDLRDGQQPRALQSADARRGRVRDDRLHIGGTAHCGVPRRHADGHDIRVRPEPFHAARAVSRSA